LRRAHGAAVDEVGLAALRGLVRYLEGGGCVALVADCDHAGTGVPVVFFGRATTLPAAAVRLARSTGAPIVPIFARRSPAGIAVSIRDALAVDRSADPAGDLADGMRLVVAQLERAIAADPNQWVVFRRVWPANPSRPAPRSAGSDGTAA
jgi:KDO2-lipid IV(A) lauroyltransferase